uniref:Uncharacterized protein n=1 Tax=Anguilla anguilla TaxID=7936 RepID=A0A0E9W3F7_ANGAN
MVRRQLVMVISEERRELTETNPFTLKWNPYYLH